MLFSLMYIKMIYNNLNKLYPLNEQQKLSQ
jgi:hypothetical protein